MNSTEQDNFCFIKVSAVPKTRYVCCFAFCNKVNGWFEPRNPDLLDSLKRNLNLQEEESADILFVPGFEEGDQGFFNIPDLGKLSIDEVVIHYREGYLRCGLNNLILEIGF